MNVNIEHKHIAMVDQNQKTIQIKLERFLFLKPTAAGNDEVALHGSWLAFNEYGTRLLQEGRDYVTADRQRRYTPSSSFE
ncbi:hypothetical protein [Aquirhabdus parva]|uniref:Uncharacterized protein n=1 Tax=Aquirhabdus parva TaxID=2283318 RepID=A0A345P8Z8_9GAMM|nr:hypothetical protein [Aquirhabdus parva]AXI03757.1 hypothetical protein HYN46_13485 [Aquirhabdus parva]